MPNPDFERIHAENLLAALNLTPESLIVADKPDIRLNINGSQIGLEVTEATPEEFLRATKKFAEMNYQRCLSTTNYQQRDERRNTIDLLAEGLRPEGVWVDSTDLMARWGSRILERMRDKLRAFGDSGFERFESNWLLIVDPLNELPNYEIEWNGFILTLLNLQKSFHPINFFDKTWIHISNKILIEWDHGKDELKLAKLAN
jgi:hypothetical protein